MKKKLLVIMLAIAMVMTFIPVLTMTASAAEVASGTSGDVNWTLTDDGTLTFSGEGAMADYSNGSQPWYAYKDSIKTVIVTKGVTSISTNAFREFSALATVKIAGSVTAIGNHAFYSCTNLSTIEYYGSSNPTAGSTAFFGTYGVVKVPSSYSGTVFCEKMVQATLDATNEPLPPCDHAGHTQTGCTACGATDESIHSFVNGFCTVCDSYEQPTLNAEGYYEIDNAGKFYWFAKYVNSGEQIAGADTSSEADDVYSNTANAVLTANITVNQNVLKADGSLNGTPARVWTPIGDGDNRYAGTFDGKGYTVSGLYVNNEDQDYVGMFGYVRYGRVKNVGVIDSYFKGLSYVGGIAGSYAGIELINCFNASTIVGGQFYAGGITGNSSADHLKNCYNLGSVSGKTYVGGIVGNVSDYYAYVEDCYNLGSVSGDSNVGGIIGMPHSTDRMLNCYYLIGCAVEYGVTQNGMGDDTPDTEGSTTGMPMEAFVSGEVAYKLGEAWGQTIGTDAYPVFRTETNQVYQLTDCDGVSVIYRNTATVTEHQEGITEAEHFDENGVCLTCGTQAVANLSVPDDLLYFMTLQDAVDAAKSYPGSTIMLLDDVKLSAALQISNTLIIDLNGHDVNATNGALLSNSDSLTITGSGSYNGDIENRGTMVINANVGGDVEAYDGKLTVTGGTIQSLVAYGDDVVSLKGGTFNSLTMIIEDPGPGISSASDLVFLSKLLANGKVYSHYNAESQKYDAEGKIIFSFENDVARFDAWFTSPVSVLEDDPVKPTISNQPVDGSYSWSDLAEALSVTATNNDDGGTLSYQWYSDTDGDAIGGTAITGATDATYTPSTGVVGTVYYYCVVTNSKTGFDSKSTTSSAVKVTVTKATLTKDDFNSVYPSDLIYNGEDKAVTVTAKDGIVGIGEITVKYYKDGNEVAVPTNGGTYTVKISVTEGDNYEAVTELEIGSFTIGKATPVLTEPTAIEDLIYNGDAQALVSAGSTTGGTLKYGMFVGEYDSSVVYGPVLEEAVPTATNVGPYIVFYMVEGGDNYEDVAMQHISVTIGKAKPTLDVTSPVTSVLPGNTILLSYTLTGVKGEALTNAVGIDSAKIGTLTCDIDGLKVTVPSTAVIGGEDKLVVTLKSAEGGNYDGSEVFTLTLGVGMADISGAITELEADIEELRELIDQKAATADVTLKLNEITSKISALEQNGATDAELEAAIDAAKSGVTQAYEQMIGGAVADLEIKIAAQIDPDELAEAVADLEGLIDAAKAYADAQDAVLKQQLDDKISDANELIASLDKRVSDAEKAIDEIETAIENLKAADAADAQALEDAIAELEQAIDNAEQAATNADTALKTELNGKIESADAALEAKIAEVQANLNKAIDDLEKADSSNSDALRDAINILNNAIDAAEAAAITGDSTLEGKITDAQNALEAKIAELQSNLEQAKKDLEAEIANGNKELSDKITALNTAINAAEAAAIAGDNALKAELERQIADAKTALNDKIDDVKAELEQAIADLETATGDDLADAVANLTDLINTTKAALETADAVNKAKLEDSIAEAEALINDRINNVKAELELAIDQLWDATDDAIADAVTDLTDKINTAKAVLEQADADNKAELEKKIEDADKALDDAIKAVQTNLDNAKAELQKAIDANEADIEEKVTNLNAALADAKAVLEQADADNKAELIKKIEDADKALDDAIKAVQKNLDDAKAELQKAIDANEADIEEKVTNLNAALADAKAVLEQADADNKAELEKKIEDADATLDAAIKTVQKNLDDAKAELQKAIDANEADIEEKVTNLNSALADAKAVLEQADADNKAELIKKIEDADKALGDAIKAVQTNLDNAKAELQKAIDANEADIEEKVTNLNAALADAKAVLEQADADNKAELVKKIEDADATLDAAIKAVQKNLDDAKAELQKAIDANEADIEEKVTNLNAALADAKAVLEQADADNKAELEKKIEDADATLDAAIKTVQKNLDDAKAELQKAIDTNEADIEEKVTNLNAALADAKAVLEQADAANKSALTAKIDEAYASLNSAISAVQKNLDDLKAQFEAKNDELAKAGEDNKAALEAKDAELQTFTIVVSIFSGAAFVGSGAFVTWFFISRKRRIL